MEGPYSSTKQFRRALEAHLTDLQVKNSSEIVKSAILIPPQEKSIGQEPLSFPHRSTSESTLISSASTPSATPISSPDKHSPLEWNALLKNRTLQLLTPHLGPQLAQEVSQEIAKTLFGTPHPDSSDVANIKSPYAWVKVAKDQVNKLMNIEQKNEVLEKWENHVIETFKESSIKTMESFYTFSLKLMDPASSFVFASTIIHGDGQARKKGIDIPI